MEQNYVGGIYGPVNFKEILRSKSFQIWLESHSELEENIELAANYFQQIIALKKFYKIHEERILATFQKSKNLWSFSYPYDWSKILTPIEFEAWIGIRRKGRMVLYPQYPVLNYHIDFANPGLKIGLELDGKKYHDPKKDLIRDKNLRGVGWTIYRITGSEMMSMNYKDFYIISDEWIREPDEIIEHLQHWILNTGDGVLQAIKEIHFEDEINSVSEFEEVNQRFEGFCHETLENHQLY